MSTEQNRNLGARWAELWNADKNLDVVVNEIVDDNFVSHSTPPGLPTGREGVRIWATVFRTAFPDIQATAEDVIVEGDKVVELDIFNLIEKRVYITMSIMWMQLKREWYKKQMYIQHYGQSEEHQ